MSFNIFLRVTVAIIGGFFAHSYFPQAPLSGDISAVQLILLASLGFVPLPWKKLMLHHEIKKAEEELLKGKPTNPCPLHGKNGPDCVVNITAFNNTAVEKLIRLTFVERVAERKAERMQEAVYRSLIPIALICIALGVAAYFASQPGALPAANNPAGSPAFMAVIQGGVGLLAFIWSTALWYGEVEMQREYSRAAQ